MKSFKPIRYTLALAGLLSIADSAFAQDSYWTNTVSGNFGDSANWSGGVPGLSTNVWFDNGQTFTVTMDGNYSTRGVIVTNGTTVTVNLNDGTPRTWEAAGPTDTRTPKIEVQGSTLIVTGNGTLDANNTPNYQTMAGLVLNGGSTVTVQNGAQMDVGYIGSITMGATDKLIVSDPGTFLSGYYLYPQAGSSILVSNGATLNIIGSEYGGGDFTIIGAGSKAQFGPYMYGATTVTITDGGRIDSTAELLSIPNVLIGGGSGVSTGQLSFTSIGDGYNPYAMKVTTNGVLEITGAYLEVRDGYGSGVSSLLTLDQGTISMQTNSQLRLKANAVYVVNSTEGGILRGSGSIKRGATPGANFQILSDGDIRPGDTSATPSIGILSVENGDLVQNDPSASNTTGARTFFDFDPTTPGSADLIDITGGTATVGGSLVFSNLVAGPLVYGTWDFLIADSITYTGTDNMAALVTALGLPGVAEVSFGVVNLGGQDILRLMVAIPEPSTVVLLGMGALLIMRRRKA